jgi:hypothetical protein
MIHTCEQYSDAWWEIRKGLPTASNANKLVTPAGKKSASSRELLNSLLADRRGLGDPPIDPTEWMLRGTELEPEARRFFEFETNLPVKEVGFVTNAADSAGCSPDGLVYEEGQPFHAGLEIKCPKASTQIGYLLKGGLPAYYKPQVHFSMVVMCVTEYHFLAYHPELTPLLVKVEWDEYTDAIAQAIEEFAADLAEADAKLKAL